MRLLLASLVALGLAACQSNTCRQGTVLLSVQLGGAASQADTIVLAISIDGAAPVERRVTPKGSSGTIEIDFNPNYPAGHTVAITVTAQAGGVVLGSGSGSTTLGAGCGTLAIGVGVTVDGGGADACVPLTTCPAAVVCGQISDNCGGNVDCGPCQLNAVTPAIANTGTTIELEGLFDPSGSAVVTFPGGATANANVLGEGRANVIVPATAGEGLLSVVANGSTTRAVPFRRVSYPLQVGATWQSTYPQTTYGRSPPLADNGHQFRAATVATDKYVFLIGGGSGSPGGDVVLQAMVNVDGTLGGFAPSPNKLPAALDFAAAIRIGDAVYVVGGLANANPSVAQAPVYRAPLQSDGTIGVFAQVGSLATARFGHTLTIVGSNLYVVGGATGTRCAATALATIERAAIAADGSLGAFADAGVALFAPRGFHGAAVYQGRLYVVGGRTQPSLTPVATAEMAPLNPDGTLGNFVSAGNALPAARFNHAALALGDTLYVVGGEEGETLMRDTVYGATFAANGTLNNFALAGTLYDPTTAFGFAVVGNELDVFGGGFEYSCGAAILVTAPRTQRASINGATGLGGFSAGSLMPTTTQSGFATVAIGPYVYLFGDRGSVAGARATLDSGGALGAFATMSVPGLTQRSRAGAAVVGNRLYIAGGLDVGNAPTSIIEVADIQPDGTLSAFSAAPALDKARAGLSLVVTGDTTSTLNLTALASGDTSAAQASVDFASGLGSALVAFATAAPASRSDATVLVDPANVAIVGGGVAATTNGSIDPGTGKLSAWAADGAASTAIRYAAGAAEGGVLYLLAGDSGLGQTNAVGRATYTTGASLTAFTNQSTTLMYSRSGASALFIGTRLWVLGGSGPSGSAQTESSELR